MSLPPGAIAYKIAFELSPIILSGGLAGAVGGYLPIIAFTEGLSFVNGVLSGGTNNDLDNFFANFQPIPGSTLAEQQIGTYPFANQAVAANAVIAQPLTVSLLMACPARGVGGYATKIATMIMLQNVISSHNAAGGTYIVATPSFVYTNCLLTALRDVSEGDSKQRQIKYQWDFTQPLLTLQQAQQAQSSLFSQFTAQTQIVGQPQFSGLANVAASGNVGDILGAAPVIPVQSQPLSLPPGAVAAAPYPLPTQ